MNDEKEKKNIITKGSVVLMMSDCQIIDCHSTCTESYSFDINTCCKCCCTIGILNTELLRKEKEKKIIRSLYFWEWSNNFWRVRSSLDWLKNFGFDWKSFALFCHVLYLLSFLLKNINFLKIFNFGRTLLYFSTLFSTFNTFNHLKIRFFYL